MEIIRDAKLEDVAKFFAELSYTGTANVSVVSPSTVTVVIFGRCSYFAEYKDKRCNVLEVAICTIDNHLSYLC